jgi:hypothetical protein
MTTEQLNTLEYWMISRLKNGPQDSSFLQRFVDFARDELDSSLSNGAGVELYLTLFKQLNLVTKNITDIS